jgi:hypothetical protein
MAANPSNFANPSNILDVMASAFSGNVLQDYHPYTSWFSSTLGQYGFININEMQSDDPDLEKGVVNGVASYGKQLGRVIEALQAICDHLRPQDTEHWAPEQREAVRSFLRLAEEIDAFKAGRQPVTKGTINQLVDALRGLKRQDPGAFGRIQQGLRED